MPQRPSLSTLQRPDLIGSYRAGQDIAGAGQQNQLRQIKIDEAERAIDERGRISGLRGQVMQDGQVNQSALKQYMLEDPAGGQAFMQSLESVKTMDDNERKRKLNTIKHKLGFLQMATDKEKHDQLKPFLKQATGIDAGEFDPKKHKLDLEMSLLMNGALTKPDNKLYKIKNKDGSTSYGTREQALAGKAPESGQTINVNTADETEEKKAMAKLLVKQFEGVGDRATAASDNLEQLYLSKNIDVKTGALEPLKNATAAFIQGFGIDPNTVGLNDATNAQAFTGIMQNLVLTKMKAQKGPQTENDAKRIEKTLADLGNTPEARVFLTDAAIALEERKVEQGNFYSDWQENKKTLTGARKSWEKHKRSTPLMGVNPNTSLPVFYNQFFRKMKEANPDAGNDEILGLWRKKYASN